MTTGDAAPPSEETEPQPSAAAKEPPAKEPFWSSGAVRTVLLSVVGIAVAGTILGLALTGPEPSSEEPTAPDVASPTEIDDEAQDDEAVVFATQVLETWAQRDLDYREWWSQLKPLLSPGGRLAYAYTQPSKVPELGDIEPLEIAEGGDENTATVFFATDAGRFGVDVSRRGPEDPWQAHRVVFPDQGSVFG